MGITSFLRNLKNKKTKHPQHSNTALSTTLALDTTSAISIVQKSTNASVKELFAHYTSTKRQRGQRSKAHKFIFQALMLEIGTTDPLVTRMQASYAAIQRNKQLRYIRTGRTVQPQTNRKIQPAI